MCSCLGCQECVLEQTNNYSHSKDSQRQAIEANSVGCKEERIYDESFVWLTESPGGLDSQSQVIENIVQIFDVMRPQSPCSPFKEQTPQLNHEDHQCCGREVQELTHGLKQIQPLLTLGSPCLIMLFRFRDCCELPTQEAKFRGLFPHYKEDGKVSFQGWRQAELPTELCKVQDFPDKGIRFG